MFFILYTDRNPNEMELCSLLNLFIHSFLSTISYIIHTFDIHCRSSYKCLFLSLFSLFRFYPLTCFIPSWFFINPFFFTPMESHSQGTTMTTRSQTLTPKSTHSKKKLEFLFFFFLCFLVRDLPSFHILLHVLSNHTQPLECYPSYICWPMCNNCFNRLLSLLLSLRGLDRVGFEFEMLRC